MTAAGTRSAQHAAVTLDGSLPTVTVRRRRAALPPSLFAASALIMLNSVLLVVDLPYASVVQLVSALLALLAVWLVPVLVAGYAWARVAITVALGAHVGAAIVDVFGTPDLRHGGLAVRAVLVSATTVILLFRARGYRYFARQRAERTIARLPKN